jgi:hypothetical protein
MSLDTENTFSASNDKEAISLFRQMIANDMGLVDYEPVLVAHRSIDGDTYQIQKASPECIIWGAPDEDGNVECTGMDYSKHGAEVIATLA